LKPHKLLLKVADWVEKHPDRYAFWSATIPTSAKETACLLAWASYFGKMNLKYLDPVAERLGFTHSGEFYSEMHTLQPASGKTWQNSGKVAARLIRKLVKKLERAAKQKEKETV
jgi:hypothetical protein